MAMPKGTDGRTFEEMQALFRKENQTPPLRMAARRCPKCHKEIGLELLLSDRCGNCRKIASLRLAVA